MIYSFYLSLTSWDGFSEPGFIGFGNFERLFRDPVFYTSLFNNLEWILVFMTIPIVMGLFIAMALNRDIPGSKFFKACFFAPMVLSLVVSGLVWSWLYNPAFGLINGVLRAVGLDSLARGWLSDPAVVMEAVIAVAVWRQVGYVMVLYLAGLQSVDPNLVDASQVDGANAVQRFFNVILPQLAPVTVVVIVISIIDSLRAFDLVSVMTRGGPFNQSSVLANFMYIEAFNNYRMGYGASISVVLFVISLGFIMFYLTRIAREEANG
jgi:ABC-type sugar transport system permease subunit